MKIAYISNLRLPSERAYGHQIARVCTAMHSLGHDVTIFSPARKNPIEKDFWDYHDVDRAVKLKYIPVFDGIDSGWTPGVLGLWLMTRNFITHLRSTFDPKEFDLIYTRTPELLSSILSFGVDTIIELHKIPRRNIRSFVQHCNRCKTAVCLTRIMKDELLALGVEESRMIVEGDAVDLHQFSVLPDQKSARASFGISNEAFVLGYAGSLKTMGLSKGVETIIEALSMLHENKNVVALIAGGSDEEVKRMKDAADHLHLSDRVKLLGNLPHNQVKDVYAAADVLIYPIPKKLSPYFLRDTSPLKIFEYMAAKKPLIAADIPPIREIVDESSALLFHADKMVESIEYARNYREESAQKSSRAFEIVQYHTWQKRMERILSSIV